jgi:hypothetical protein
MCCEEEGGMSEIPKGQAGFEDIQMNANGIL